MLVTVKVVETAIMLVVVVGKSRIDYGRGNGCKSDSDSDRASGSERGSGEDSGNGSKRWGSCLWLAVVMLAVVVSGCG